MNPKADEGYLIGGNRYSGAIVARPLNKAAAGIVLSLSQYRPVNVAQ